MKDKVSPKVLVVDDEEIITYSLSYFLLTDGYDAITAKDCHEAFAKISETDFDLILTDLILPDGSGIDILKGIKAKNPSCPVVVMTGAPDMNAAVEAVRLGAYDYIAKPVLRETLLHIARTAIQI